MDILVSTSITLMLMGILGTTVDGHNRVVSRDQVWAYMTQAWLAGVTPRLTRSPDRAIPL